MSLQREEKKRERHVVNSRWNVGDSLCHVPVKKGWVGGGADNDQDAKLDSTMGTNL